MMPSGQEVSAGLRGAWQLLRFDANGMSRFDESVDAFWKSFYAAILTVPGYVIVLAIHLGEAPIQVGFFKLFLIEGLAYVIEWTAYPLAVYYIADMMGRGENFIRFVIALNWSRVIQLLIYLPIILLVEGESFSPQLGIILTLIASSAILVYQWFVTKTALAIAGLAAVMLVVLDLIISIVITGVTDGMVL